MELRLTEDEKRIYSTAFNEIRLKKKYRSPFRPDPHPSLEFYINNKSKRLWWKDWGTGDGGNCYDFLDRWVGELKPKAISIKNVEKEPPKIVYKEISNIRFWEKIRITKPTLDLFNVKQVDTVNGYIHTHSYIYLLPKERYRVYSPKSHTRFWGTMKKTDIFGWEQLPETGNLLVITKSLKDVMVLYEMGISAISFASETATPTKKIIDELKERFTDIIILYDNDKTGIEQSARIGKVFGIRQMFLKSAKDISDCVEKITFDEAHKEFWDIYLQSKSEVKNKQAE